MFSKKFIFRLATPAYVAVFASLASCTILELVLICWKLPALFSGDAWSAAWLILGSGALFSVFCVIARVGALFAVGFGDGYQPWEWGMVPVTEEGEAAMSLGISLTVSQVKMHFKDPER